MEMFQFHFIINLDRMKHFAIWFFYVSYPPVSNTSFLSKASVTRRQTMTKVTSCVSSCFYSVSPLVLLGAHE